jgi:protein-disulfide isomerase/uncharacterized membrane protein
MKNKNTLLNSLIVSLLISMAVFAYLTYHHYSLKLGIDSGSLCQISSTVNCDAAASSSYSEIGSIPISLIGLSFAGFMTVFFLLIKLGLIELNNYGKSVTISLFGASFLFSIFLGFITLTQLKAVCPFCLAGYALSLVQLILIIALFKSTDFKFSFGAITENIGLTGSFLIIPFLSWVVAKNINTSYNLDQIKQLVTEKTEIWKRAQEYTFDKSLGLIKGDINSKVTLIEFADFKCPHCKSASVTLKKFKQQTPELAVIFKPFPLDGQCNPNIESKGDKSRCTMAGWVLCAEKISQKGWETHDWLFENQEKFFPLYGENLDKEFKEFAAKQNLSFDEISLCANSSDTAVQIGKMSEEAKVSQVQGTPTIFLNNRRLEAAQILDVLKNAYGTLQ